MSNNEAVKALLNQQDELQHDIEVINYNIEKAKQRLIGLLTSRNALVEKQNSIIKGIDDLMYVTNPEKLMERQDSHMEIVLMCDELVARNKHMDAILYEMFGDPDNWLK